MAIPTTLGESPTLSLGANSHRRQRGKAGSGVAIPITLGERPTLSVGANSHHRKRGTAGSGVAIPTTLGESPTLSLGAHSHHRQRGKAGSGVAIPTTLGESPTLSHSTRQRAWSNARTAKQHTWSLPIIAKAMKGRAPKNEMEQRKNTTKKHRNEQKHIAEQRTKKLTTHHGRTREKNTDDGRRVANVP